MSYFACLLSVVSFFVVFASNLHLVTLTWRLLLTFSVRFQTWFMMFESYTSANATCDVADFLLLTFYYCFWTPNSFGFGYGYSRKSVVSFGRGFGYGCNQKKWFWSDSTSIHCSKALNIITARQKYDPTELALKIDLSSNFLIALTQAINYFNCALTH